jgi:hypothetical protein
MLNFVDLNIPCQIDLNLAVMEFMVKKKVKLVFLEPAKPVCMLTQFCDPRAMKVKEQVNVNVCLQLHMSASASDTVCIYIFITPTLCSHLALMAENY